MITYRTGDLFTSGLPAIAHGVNCQGVMGAGIAAQFRQRHPKMFEAYRARCAGGGFWPGDVLPWNEPACAVVFNLATQSRPGPDAQPWMITAAVGRMIQLAHYSYGVREIGLPMIGCGIGGLTRNDLAASLLPYSNAPVNLTVFEYAPAASSEHTRSGEQRHD